MTLSDGINFDYLQWIIKLLYNLSSKSVATDSVVPNVHCGTLCYNCPLVVLQLTPWYGASCNTWHPVLKHLLF